MKNILDNLRYRVTHGWNFLRIIRVVLAVIITVEAFKTSEILFGVLGIFLALQAVLNYGCCGVSGCDTGHNYSKPKSSDSTAEVTTFEEVK